jgi:hypothetical protein
MSLTPCTGAANSAAAADYLNLPERHVHAAMDYYKDFADEVDQYRAERLGLTYRG